ncbi:MAG: Na/Pi cotransporter family protein [Planctomycetes bacterium]|nr:Na/Pi cotransporter family protein [Planctomycetota bacterium]
MIREMLFGAMGGLGLFLFGMGLMSDGLKKVAGQKLKGLIGSLTKHRVIAILVGALTTCLVQSSSATTVMTIGFVNAGLLTLKQALCVVLGANIGTTFTAWIVSVLGTGLKITQYALPAIGIGFLFRIAGKTQKWRSIGNIVLGFGLLFIGIGFMKDGFSPLQSSEDVQAALIWLGRNPILAVLAGTVITVLLQSSSASIAMIQVLAFGGAFGNDWNLVLQVTIPFILGDNIGTTITAQIAAFRANRNSKRTAMGHTIFNVIGVAYMLPLIWSGLFPKLVMLVSPWELGQGTIMVHMAIAHSVFNVFNTIIFLPLMRWLELIVMKILPVKEEELEEKPVVLEMHLLSTPVIALEQAKREIIRMGERARKAVARAINGLLEGDKRELEKVMVSEDLIDEFQHEITSYLVSLSREQLSDVVAVELPTFLHTVNDLERIGDHAVNIVEIAERKIEQKMTFSEDALVEAERLRVESAEMFENVLQALCSDDLSAAKRALENEDRLNQMQMDFRRSHVRRMSEGHCSPESGLIFIDLVDNVEKIGDHLTNIAQAVLGGLKWHEGEK